MASDIDREIEGEVTRVEAVRYLQGALGHAIGSLLVLGLAGLFWVRGYGTLGWAAVAVAALVSANGLSIWAWNQLRTYFTPDPGTESTQTRTLTATPLAGESRVELKAGAVMSGALLALLVLGNVALDVLGPQIVGSLAVTGLAVGNVAALARSIRTHR